MAIEETKPGDEKEFCITGLSRGDVRTLFGDKIADKLTDEDLKSIAGRMADSYVSVNFVDDLTDIINDGYSDEFVEPMTA